MMKHECKVTVIDKKCFAALQGGAIMKGWTNGDRMMIACCNDGTRPVIFKIERIDIPETLKRKNGWQSRTSITVPRKPIPANQ